MLIPFREPGLFNVTLNTTEDCNLRCTYCYEVHKRRRTLSMEDAKAFIGHILTDPDPAGLLDDPDPVFRKAYQKGLVVDFIGGDSFMDVPFWMRSALHAGQGDDHRYPQCQKLAGQASFLHFHQRHALFRAGQAVLREIQGPLAGGHIAGWLS